MPGGRSRWLLAALLAATSPAQAQEYEIPEDIRRPPQLPDGSGGLSADDALPLTLSEAIQIAVRQNLDIALQRHQAVSAAHTSLSTFGRVFEPQLSAFYGYTNAAVVPSVSLLQQRVLSASLYTVSNQWNINLSQALPTGALLAVNFGNTSTLSNSSGAALQFPLLYNAGLTLQLTQPLLKGFAFDLAVPQSDVLHARISAAQQRKDIQTALLNTVHATEDAYWDVVNALKTWEIQSGSVRLAQEQQRLTRRQIEAGILPPSDLLSAESTLAQRQVGLVGTETTIHQAMDQLRYVLNLPRAEWSRPLLPIDAAPRFDTAHPSLEEATAEALRRRPEIARQRLDVEHADLNVRSARSDRLPRLDVSVSYGLVGQRVSYAETLSQLLSGAVPTWTVSANFVWTPLMLAARAALSAREADRQATRATLVKGQLDRTVEVRAAVRNLDSAVREVRAAARARDLAVKVLDLEQRKFMNGTATNGIFVIGQRQGDLLTAKLQELTALTKHHKAATALSAATGALLEERGIQIDAQDN